jgi:hypothetical protein
MQVPLSVCDVLQNYTRYREQMIEVRGEWTGPGLGPTTNCQPFKTTKTGDFVWLSGIWLVLPVQKNEIDTPANWAVEEPAYRRAADKLRATNLDKQEIIATIAGRLEANDLRHVVRRVDSNLLPYGYGHLGQFPAQLVISTIKDLEISPR